MLASRQSWLYIITDIKIYSLQYTFKSWPFAFWFWKYENTTAVSLISGEAWILWKGASLPNFIFLKSLGFLVDGLLMDDSTWFFRSENWEFIDDSSAPLNNKVGWMLFRLAFPFVNIFPQMCIFFIIYVLHVSTRNPFCNFAWQVLQRLLTLNPELSGKW